MGLGHSPQIVTRNLLLNLDFGNVQKCYNGSENLLTYSEQFDNVVWTNQGSFETTNAIASPDGLATAEKLIGDNGQANRQSIYQSVNVTSGTTYTFSVFLKQAERRYATIWFDNVSITEGAYYGAATYIDLQTGTTATGTQTRIDVYPNGWYRCYVTATPSFTGTLNLNTAIGTPNNAADGAGTIAYQYTGNGTSGIYVWGAQFERGRSPSPYFPTTATTRTRPTTATSRISNYSHTINQPEYISYDGATNSIRFDRNETFASFTGSITGSVLDVTATSGINTIRVGAALSFSGRSANALYITSLGTGIGTTGTYNLNVGTATTTSRAMAAAIKEGGNIRIDTSGLLASNTYLYNDHTTEVWARINDRNPSNYDLTEGDSALFMFVGFHSMFLYNLYGLTYYVWSSTGPAIFTTSYLTIGTSGTDIIQGQWFHVVVTKSGSTYRTYLNGTLRKTDTISATAYSSVSNILKLGSGYESNTGIYNVYGKNNIGCVKMYNTALTADEISQNFNALRGRYGI